MIYEIQKELADGCWLLFLREGDPKNHYQLAGSDEGLAKNESIGRGQLPTLQTSLRNG